MADQRRNAEHYMDMTAYMGIKNAERELGMYPKAGEIWIVEKNGVENTVVVVAAHAEHCTVLQLDDRLKNVGDIKITARSVMYTDPSMLSYRYNRFFTEIVKKMPDGEFADLLGAVADALCIKADDQSDELEAKDAEIASLNELICEYDDRLAEEGKKVDRLKSENTKLMAQVCVTDVSAIQAERDVYRRLYEQTIATMIENLKEA